MNEVPLKKYPVLVKLVTHYGFKPEKFNIYDTNYIAEVYFDSTGERVEYRALIVEDGFTGSHKLVVAEQLPMDVESGEYIDFTTFLIMTNGGDAYVVQ